MAYEQWQNQLKKNYPEYALRKEAFDVYWRDLPDGFAPNFNAFWESEEGQKYFCQVLRTRKLQRILHDKTH